MDLKWQDRMIDLAHLVAGWSKDPRTQVGAVIVAPGTKHIIATGFNGLPRGISDLSPYYKAPLKYYLVEHAEANAIHQCARLGVSTEGAILVLNWAPIVCSSCARACVQAGIRTIIGPDRPFPWHGQRDQARQEDINNGRFLLLNTGTDVQVSQSHPLALSTEGSDAETHRNDH